MQADLDTRYGGIQRRRGRSAARRWYRWQVARGIVARGRHEAAAAVSRCSGGLGLAARILARRPLHSLGVAGTLGLGLAAAAAVATVTWTVWLRPLPIPEPGRVVRIYERQPPEISTAGALLDDPRRSRVSPPLLEDLRSSEWTTLQAIAGLSRDRRSWTRDDRSEGVSATLVSPEMDEVLGLAPRVGRWFTDDAAGPREVVLTRDFFLRAFGGDPATLGSTMLELDGVPHRVVGVVELPSGVLDGADIVLPLAFDPEELSEGMRGARYLEVLGRLRPGADAAAAEGEVGAAIDGLGTEHAAHRGWDARVVGLSQDLFAPYRAVLTLLMAAGAAFLLLAGANVVGLVASRRAGSREDRAVRRALGATESHLLVDSILEGALLGCVGGSVGWVGAAVLLLPIRALVPAEVPRAGQIDLDPATGLLVVAAGVLLGVATGIGAFVVSRGGALNGPARRGGSTAGLRARRALVVTQLSLTTLLVAAGGGILERMVHLQRVETGFEGAGVQVSHIAFDARRHPSDEALTAAWTGTLDRLRAQGLEAAVGTNPPAAGSTMRFGFRPVAGGEQMFAQYHSVTEGYLELLSIALLEGRGFDDEDDASSEPVVIVSEALARTHFPDASPVGREIEVVGTTRRIVGVVASTHHFGPDQGAPEELYVPLAQDPWAVGHLMVRSDRRDVPEAMERAIQFVDPTVEPPAAAPYAGYVARWYAPIRLQLIVVGVLGLAGLALAILGLYAVTVVHVESRRREMGIRMALGAAGSSLFAGVLAGGVTMALLGTAVGLGAWGLFHPVLAGLVPLPEGGWASTFAVAVGVPLASTLATLRPAWRSTRLDPRETLSRG